MAVYDCFIFFNELDLLELRLRILDPVVDFFVLVEARKTHAGRDKPLYFSDNRDRFSSWSDKIIHVVVDSLPLPTKFSFGGNWRLNSIFGIGRFRPEIAQRKAVIRGLSGASDDDIILVSDLDEIPNPKKFGLLNSLLRRYLVVSFDQRMFYYYLNGLKGDSWLGTKACTFRSFKRLFSGHAEWLRRLRSIRVRLLMRRGLGHASIPDGGWHFSYLGDTSAISHKIRNLSHGEHDRVEFTDEGVIRSRILSGQDLFGRSGSVRYVPLDSSFPDEVLNNRDRYARFICDA